MRQVLIAVLLCGAAKAESSDGGTRARVTIQLIDKANVPGNIMGQAMGEASRLLETADVRLDWTQQQPQPETPATGQEKCGASRAALFTVKVLPFVTAGVSPTANASANVRTGVITVFYDRVRASVIDSPRMLPIFLAYVLAHEIAHMSQMVSKHSTSGIMKAGWTTLDYRDMEHGRLQFTPDDIRFIVAGLAFRACPNGSTDD